MVGCFRNVAERKYISVLSPTNPGPQSDDLVPGLFTNFSTTFCIRVAVDSAMQVPGSRTVNAQASVRNTLAFRNLVTHCMSSLRLVSGDVHPTQFEFDDTRVVATTPIPLFRTFHCQ
jgi:hypothetical protein